MAEHPLRTGVPVAHPPGAVHRHDRVVGGLHLQQVVLGPDARLDGLHLAEELQRRSVAPAHHRRRDQGVQHTAVGPQVALLADGLVPDTCDQLARQRLLLLVVGGQGELAVVPSPDVGGRLPEQVRQGAVHLEIGARCICDGHARRQLGEQVGEARVSRVPPPQRLARDPDGGAHLQQRCRLPPQHLQRAVLVLRQVARHGVQHAQAPDRVALVGDQRSSGVEPDLRAGRHQRVLPEAGIGQRVLDDHHLVRRLQGARAEGELARDLGDVQARRGLEPVPLAVDQPDRRHGRAADRRHHDREIVEVGLRRGVEHLQRAQSGDAGVLVVVVHLAPAGSVRSAGLRGLGRGAGSLKARTDCPGTSSRNRADL